ncbi:SDR family NAD(P)-dependent oxidoreductase [Pseudomonas citronellolis]|uniref:SDR family NAD(P)-dependent oxidoreductase n=1 Tax=Pseudomonas citronellolis TaxID=53408 RepID=UPI00209EC358|nr:glucose 1-dehydrogenase [Pseudomonas citronellolis]MCP1603167.1 NAD(P)-dependent dehydrogenase (short-subunit alcohol dehydrogenase family) [Pseudomonas citronellolis]MCP1654225.1 NAD(P)-dependent dehydrogenase (short-subunit alcohol dehydrogenase family) [Pseudomonas citronellolis]MCP1720878.1 NAD(P)-dependent dehydrogenase (short-subunit alcohol dehydrogenase family) [Pseudomonas citronellolis]
MGKLNDKIALVTGGNSGIGLATAQRFAREGATVVITGRRRQVLDEAVGQIGGNALGICADASRLADIDALYQRIGQLFGRLDVLVANAGVIRPAAGEQVDEAQFDEQFDINVKGVFYSIQKALPLLRDGGSIVLVSSIAHLKALDAHVVYAATKAAVRSFARSWAGELRQRNIRVNCLSPGPVLTPIIGKMGIGDEQFAAFERQVTGLIPLGRLGRPEELANAALFLASDDSSFITGVDLCVDGGLSQL